MERRARRDDGHGDGADTSCLTLEWLRPSTQLRSATNVKTITGQPVHQRKSGIASRTTRFKT